MRFQLALTALLLSSGAQAFGPALRPTTTMRPLTQLQAEITMPALSSTMKEGRVVSWLKSEGDEIEAGDAIMVVESDKADMDVEAFEDGILAKILVGEGEMAPVGQAVALIAESADQVDSIIAGFSSGGAAPPVVEEAAAPAASGAGRWDDRCVCMCHLWCKTWNRCWTARVGFFLACHSPWSVLSLSLVVPLSCPGFSFQSD